MIAFPSHDAQTDSARKSYLRSPIIQLVVGTGDTTTTLSVHQALLVQSPHFAEAVSRFTDTAQTRRIELPNDDLTATSSVLEYLYKGDYFPTLQGAQTMEYDPTVPSPDNDGVAHRQHGRPDRALQVDGVQGVGVKVRKLAKGGQRAQERPRPPERKRQH